MPALRPCSRADQSTQWDILLLHSRRPSHLPAWLGMIGDATNQNVHPLWLHTKINQQEVENEIQYSI